GPAMSASYRSRQSLADRHEHRADRTRDQPDMNLAPELYVRPRPDERAIDAAGQCRPHSRATSPSLTLRSRCYGDVRPVRTEPCIFVTRICRWGSAALPCVRLLRTRARCDGGEEPQ